MKVVFTEDALRDLDEILQYISTNYPGVYGPFEKRLRTIVTRIDTWPGSAQEVV
jgi:plasmid stabilization system protein ParE